MAPVIRSPKTAMRKLLLCLRSLGDIVPKPPRTPSTVASTLFLQINIIKKKKTRSRSIPVKVFLVFSKKNERKLEVEERELLTCANLPVLDAFGVPLRALFEDRKLALLVQHFQNGWWVGTKEEEKKEISSSYQEPFALGVASSSPHISSAFL